MTDTDPYAEIQKAAMAVYERGLLDGLATAFGLMLGKPDGAMEAYPGLLNKSAREWAEIRLAAVRQTQVEAWVPE
jgi:hypothetical protein